MNYYQNETKLLFPQISYKTTGFFFFNEIIKTHPIQNLPRLIAPLQILQVIQLDERIEPFLEEEITFKETLFLLLIIHVNFIQFQTFIPISIIIKGHLNNFVDTYKLVQMTDSTSLI